MLDLKPYQQRGVEKAINQCHGRILFWVPMGRGKTPMAAKTVSILGCRRIIVLVKESGVSIWTRHTTDPERLLGWDWLEHFSGVKVVVHNMDKLSPAEREIVWNTPTPKEEMHVFVCIYNTFARDMGQINRQKKKRAKKESVPLIIPPKLISAKTKFDCLIADECKRLGNRDTANAQAAEKLVYENKVPYVLELTGTPGDKGPISFWTYLRLIDRKRFHSYWEYVQHFYTTGPAMFGGGLEIFEQRVDTKAEWDRVLDNHVYIVHDHELEGPPLERQKVYCDFEPDQKVLYDQMLKDMVSIAGDSIVFAQNSMVQLLRLRQILICPKMLGNDFGYGGAIKQFCDLLEDENVEERHTVIFTPFTKAFGPFTEYLLQRGFKDVFHLEGGISPTQQDARIDDWRKTKGVMLCSTLYAEAFSLEPARKGWGIGFDYTPDVNAQAEKRLMRFTTKYPVTINYFTYGSPTDERMTDIIAIKQERINWSLPENIRKLVLGQL